MKNWPFDVRLMIRGIVTWLSALTMFACATVGAEFIYPPPPQEGVEDYFKIAENGEAKCVIVHPAEKLGLRKLANALKNYLKEATGADFRVQSDAVAVPEPMGAIHVGETKAAAGVPLDLPDVVHGDLRLPNLNGFEARTLDPKTLLIRGLTEKGVEFGIVGLLRRYAGVRDYWNDVPGGIGVEIPKKTTLSLPETRWRSWPYFFSRASSRDGYGGRPRLDFFRRNKLLPPNENIYKIFDSSVYGDCHPEFYPLINGERFIPDSGAKRAWQICASNPDVLKLAAKYLVDWFQGDSTRVAKNLTINDGYGDCECAGCRAMDAPGTDYSRRTLTDRYVTFNNRAAKIVGETFPDRLIVFLSYSGTRQPPMETRTSPTVIPVLAMSSFLNAFAHWDAWLKSGAKHMGAYQYHDDSIFLILPKLDVHQAARRVHRYVDGGAALHYNCEDFSLWPISAMTAYVAGELTWDPRRDVDQILDEYYSTFFGPAAAEMTAFYSILEEGYERWLAENGVPSPLGKDIGSSTHARQLAQFQLLTIDEANEAAARLKAAATAALDADARFQKRIQAVSLLFGLIRKGVELYWLTEKVKTEPVDSEAQLNQRIDDLNRVFALRDEIAEYVNEDFEKAPRELTSYWHDLRKKRNTIYQQFKTGEENLDVLAAVEKGVAACVVYLGGTKKPVEAAAFWEERLKENDRTELDPFFRVAKTRSWGKGEVVAESKFNQAAKALAAAEGVTGALEEVPISREKESLFHKISGASAHVWFPDVAPYKLVLTKNAPGGDYAFMANYCHRVRVSINAAVGEKRCFGVGLKFKRDDAPGSYHAEVTCRKKDGSYATLSRIRRGFDGATGKWSDISGSVEAPPDADVIMLNVFVKGQSLESHCWIADMVIRQLGVDKLEKTELESMEVERQSSNNGGAK